MRKENIILDRPHPAGEGRQIVFRFANGFGASVIRLKTIFGFSSYTDDETKWELAVIKFNGENFNLVYDTPITSDVIDNLKEEEVDRILEEIEKL